MIKRYLPDISCLFLATLIAFIFAGKPPTHPSAGQVGKAVIKAPPLESLQEAKVIDLPIEPDKALKERDIFAASGTYQGAAGQPLPDNSYSLIAVLEGEEKKAVFRDYSGIISTLPVGKKLMDGYVIARIDTLSVQLKKNDEQKELRLFNSGGAPPPPVIDKGGVIPKNLYTLIGILGGNEQKAVFRDYKGSIAILGIGAKLIDGAVITGIDPGSVKLKKGKENNELKVFDARSSEQAIRKKS